MEQQKQNTNKRKKIFIFVGLGAGLLAVTGLGYWYFFGRKGADVKDPDNDLFKKLSDSSDRDTNYSSKSKPSITHTNTSTSYTPAKNSNSPETHSGFPLKKGSKGALVKQLQQALIKNYGNSILPKWGADGAYGTEVITALQSKGFPSEVDFTTFTKIITGGTNTPTPSAPATTPKISLDTNTAISIASNLKKNIDSENFWGAVGELKKIKSGADYKTVNQVFSSLREDEKEKNISEAMLSAFPDGMQRALMILQFGKVGLKSQNGVWSISGIVSKQIITTTPTIIKNHKGASLKIPAKTILGTEIFKRNGQTVFETVDGRQLYVPTRHVKYV